MSNIMPFNMSENNFGNSVFFNICVRLTLLMNTRVIGIKLEVMDKQR